MPRIPTLQTGDLGGGVLSRPPISPEAMAAPGKGLAQAASQIGQTAQNIGETFAKIQAREAEADATAERNLKALEFSRDFDQEVGAFAETLNERQDYDKFEEDTERFLQESLERYRGQIGGDKVLQIAFERSYNQQAATVLDVAKRAKRQVMTDRALGAFETSYNKQLQNYAGEPDPQMREIIRGDIEIQTAQLVASRFMSQADAEKKIQNFHDEAERVRADQLIEADPTQAEEALKTGDFPTLDPKIRQEKVEKAKVRQKQLVEAEKQAQAALEKREAAAKKEAHDTEERSLGELFLSGDYESVVPALMKTEHLTGDELRTWSEAARTRIDSIGKDTDKAKQAESIVMINAKIARGDAPDEIRRSILTDPYLTQENQEQYLGKLETKLGGAMDEGRKAGYQVIGAMLAPKSDPVAGIFTTPLDTAAAAMAQGDLDTWLDAQKADGKSPSIQEIRAKSISFAVGRTVSFADKVGYIKQSAEAARASMVK